MPMDALDLLRELDARAAAGDAEAATFLPTFSAWLVGVLLERRAGMLDRTPVSPRYPNS